GVSEVAGPRPLGPDALPAGAVRPARSRATTRLRKPAEVLAVTVPRNGRVAESATAAGNTWTEQATADVAVPATAVPTEPVPDAAADASDVVFVEVNKRHIVAATVLAPPVVLAVVLTAVAIGVHWGRLGLDLAGGALLPVGDLGQLWSSYLAAWQPVTGGDVVSAPPALAVLGVLGAPLVPLGGPAALV